MLTENFKIAFKVLWANKLRTMLTMLGIMIGISAVIAIITVGDTYTWSMNSEMIGYGMKNIVVQVEDRRLSSTDQCSYLAGETDEIMNQPSDQELISEDMLSQYEEKFTAEIGSIGLFQSVASQKMTQGHRSASVNIIGVNSGYQKAQNVKMLAGEFINRNETQNSLPIAVVSDRFVSQYYGTSVDAADVIGKPLILQVGSQARTVYIGGVYQFEEANSYVRTTDSNLYVPYTFGFRLQNRPVGFSSLIIVPKTTADNLQLTENTGAFFSSFYVHNKKITAVTSTGAASMKLINTFLSSFKLIIGGIAAISLLVGGIGIMNIMMVSVTERTREIGIRMALGARGGTIRMQFLIEAMMVSLLGGICGILIGIGLGNVMAHLILKTGARISLFAILISAGTSMAIGMFFGYVPANKASHLDPIDALRYE